jgi:hypothetical protein
MAFVIERNDPCEPRLVEYACGSALHLWGRRADAARFPTRENAEQAALIVALEGAWRVVEVP